MENPLRASVLASQIESLLETARQKRLRLVEGVAFIADGNSCHVFSERPPYQPAGNPVPGFFVIVEGGRLPEGLSGKLASMGADAGTPVVLVDAAGRAPVRAFVGTEPGEGFPVAVLSPEKDLASRRGALLEGSLLSERRVMIVGVGSFGSVAALELAKAGVGRFILADMDRLEPGNVSRHACGIADVGRYKTFAVRDAIFARNPDAEVDTLEADVNTQMEYLREAGRHSDVILCLTDSARSRFNVNAAAVSASRPALFGRAVTRAAGGDVFRYRPGGPCLSCLFSAGAAPGEEEVSSPRQVSGAEFDYAPPGYAAGLVQPGLSNDIAPIVQMVVKLALLELSPRTAPLWRKLDEDLEAPFYVWANRREGIYEDYPPMQYAFNRSSVMRWYGVRVPRDGACLACGLG
ncbi:MAG TPA: ThiF family adenylyltransferase [Opitutales bacterium]|mgnify:CR=1 FL=1|nr:ThiF family adenylyltransferase [Opitutales bacterium]